MRDVKRINSMMNDLANIMSDGTLNSFFTILNHVLDRNLNFYIEDDIVAEKFAKAISAGNKYPNEDKMFIVNFLRSYWKHFPDWRFLQLINNLFYEYEYRPDLYAALSDKDLVEGIKNNFPEMTNND